MARKPYHSSLIPYGDDIILLRRKRPPTPYARIAELLKEKHQITVSREAVFYFIKRRVKKDYKPSKYDAWNAELSNANNQPTMETKVIEPPKVLKPPAMPEDDDDFEIPKLEYSDTYNLTLMSPEEAIAFEERIRRKKERDKLKEKK